MEGNNSLQRFWLRHKSNYHGNMPEQALMYEMMLTSLEPIRRETRKTLKDLNMSHAEWLASKRAREEQLALEASDAADQQQARAAADALAALAHIIAPDEPFDDDEGEPIDRDEEVEPADFFGMVDVV